MLRNSYIKIGFLKRILHIEPKKSNQLEKVFCNCYKNVNMLYNCCVTIIKQIFSIYPSFFNVNAIFKLSKKYKFLPLVIETIKNRFRS